MKKTYYSPDCEVFLLETEGNLCLSGQATIEQLSTEELDGGDYDQLY